MAEDGKGTGASLEAVCQAGKAGAAGGQVETKVGGGARKCVRDRLCEFAFLVPQAEQEWSL